MIESICKPISYGSSFSDLTIIELIVDDVKLFNDSLSESDSLIFKHRNGYCFKKINVCFYRKKNEKTRSAVSAKSIELWQLFQYSSTIDLEVLIKKLSKHDLDSLMILIDNVSHSFINDRVFAEFILKVIKPL